MTDKFGKLTRAIPVPKITAPHVATVVLENLIKPYGIPIVISNNNGRQFVSEFFAALCASLGTQLVATTEYHP